MGEGAAPGATVIVDVDAWEVLDSRGRPTIACRLWLRGGAQCTVAVPSGASVGSHEARELRDGGSRYDGFGVLNAVENVRTRVRDTVLGRDAGDQESIDELLRAADGTPQLSELGANAVLAVSVAVAVASAAAAGVALYQWIGDKPLLPVPMVNILSGGAHAGRLVDIQDVLAVPQRARSFSEALEVASQVRAGTAAVASEAGHLAGLVADEGGIAVSLPRNRDALELVCRGIEHARLVPGTDVALALDVAASQFYRDGLYDLAVEDRQLDSRNWVDELVTWKDAFPIVSIEDACAEDDWDGWSYATEQLRDIQLVGDDLFATNSIRLAKGLHRRVANAVLIKPNQNGTLTGTRQVLGEAQNSGYATIVSARSGETEDSWLADLAVGWRSGQIKIGSTMRSERTAKWNRLLAIERELGSAAEYAPSPSL